MEDLNKLTTISALPADLRQLLSFPEHDKNLVNIAVTIHTSRNHVAKILNIIAAAYKIKYAEEIVLNIVTNEEMKDQIYIVGQITYV